jgi:hypothetical protein
LIVTSNQNINKSTVKSQSILSFSNVSVTSASQGNTTAQSQDDEIKKPSTTSPSILSFSYQLL